MFYKCHVKHIFTNISWESTLFSDMNQEFVSSVPSIFIVLWYDMIKLDMIWIDDAAEYEKISVMKIIHTRKESLALLWNPEVWYLISNIWNIWYEIFDICYEIQRFDKLLVLRPFIHTVPLPCQGNSLNDHFICNKSIDLKTKNCVLFFAPMKKSFNTWVSFNTLQIHIIFTLTAKISHCKINMEHYPSTLNFQQVDIGKIIAPQIVA